MQQRSIIGNPANEEEEKERPLYLKRPSVSDFQHIEGGDSIFERMAYDNS